MAVGLKHGAVRRVSGGVPGFQLLPEGRKGDVEAVTAGVQVALRPEQLDQYFARVGASAVVGEIGEQIPGLPRAEMGDDLGVAFGAQAAEEMDVPARSHT